MLSKAYPIVQTLQSQAQSVVGSRCMLILIGWLEDQFARFIHCASVFHPYMKNALAKQI